MFAPFCENASAHDPRPYKLYLLDSGLACTLTRQPSADAAVAGAMGGAFLEGWVVSESMKIFGASGRRPELHFWRSHDGLEVDLLIRIQDRLVPVEIKMTSSPTVRHVEPLERFKGLSRGLATDEGLLVCNVEELRHLPHGNLALPWHEFPACATIGFGSNRS